MHPAIIGPYKIVRELGRGGMGEVFLALDTRLDRRVAIKALPVHLAKDPDRLSRFQREAKVLASLSHPGIGAIYGLEEDTPGGHLYLILEYIEGETIADRLVRGALPIDEALGLATQIAEALEVAHEKGVIHRDLKPSNVMITLDDVAKVLDFGLARAEEAPPSSAAFPLTPDSPTMTSPVPMHSPTIPGAIMGTAGYMSPEQARGRSVDKRSDIFSFGCVLYEMLTGAPPFRGETIADSIGATLHKELDLSLLPQATPRRVRDLLANCLTKDRKNRLHDIGDARLELRRALTEPGDEMLTSPAALPWWRAGGLLATACVLAIAAITVAWILRPQPGATNATRGGVRVARATLAHPAGLSCRIGDRSMALSPDGRRVVVALRAIGSVSGWSLYLRDLSKLEFLELPGTTDATYPFWSPDGKSIAFFAGTKLKRIDLADGIVRVLCDAPAGRGGSWGSKGTIVFAASANGGLSVVSDAGGTPTPLTTTKAPDESHRLPQMLPDGERLLFYFAHTGASGVYAFDSVTQETRLVLESEGEARFVEPGHLAFVRDGNLLVQPFDPVRLELTGIPQPIAAGLRHNYSRQFINFDLSAGGTLVYLPVGALQRRRLAWMSDEGIQSPIAIDPLPMFGSTATLAPDGRRAVAVVVSEEGKLSLVMIDLERGTQASIGDPMWRFVGLGAWCAGTQRYLCVALSSRTHSIWSIPLVGGGSPEVVWSEPGVEFHPESITPDESTLVFSQWNNRDKLGEIMVMRLAPDQKPRPFMTTAVNEYLPRVSPSGLAVAYLEQSSGGMDQGAVKVVAYPSPSMPVTVSRSGGVGSHSVFWLGENELAWSDLSRRVWSATISVKDDEVDAGPPKPVFDGRPLEENTGILAYDHSRKRFLMGINEEAGEEPSLVYVSDWRSDEIIAAPTSK